LASSNKRVAELHPEKIVIVAGPTFGTVVQFMLLGAALGAAGVLYYHRQNGPRSAKGGDAVLEGVTAGGSKDTASLQQLGLRLNNVATRAKSVASRVRDTVHTASELIGPTIQEAVATAKTAAQETEQKMQEDLHRAPEAPPPDAPSVAAEQA